MNFSPNELGGLLYDYGETVKFEQSKFRFSEKTQSQLVWPVILNKTGRNPQGAYFLKKPLDSIALLVWLSHLKSVSEKCYEILLSVSLCINVKLMLQV